MFKVNVLKNNEVVLTTRTYETRAQAYEVQSYLFNWFMFENNVQFEIKKITKEEI